jgi:Ca2+-binding EF-hand superfamily protein
MTFWSLCTFQVAMDQFESPEARAAGIFKRMDVNSDGRVTRTEFVKTCLDDQKLIELLTPHAPT